MVTGIRKGVDGCEGEVEVDVSCGVGVEVGIAFGRGAALAPDRRRREETAMDSFFIFGPCLAFFEP